MGDYGQQVGVGDDEPNIYWTGSAGDNTYRHNPAGAQYSRSGPDVEGGAQTIDYTTFDLPSHITKASRSYGVDYRYDASGTRTIKATSTTGVPLDTTFYMGDLFQRVEHPNDAPTSRNMIYVAGRLIAIATVNGGDVAHPTLHYLHSDALGSIQTVTSNEGAVEATRDFSAYGVERGGQALFDQIPYGFTGQEHDADLGLINMHGRIYDPVLGEFLSPDPLTPNPMGHGLNAFAYVNNQPLDYVDPSGYVASVVGTDFGASMGGGLDQGWFAGHPGGWDCFACGGPAGSMGAEATANSFQEGSLSPGLEAMSAVQLVVEVVDLVTKNPPLEKSTGLSLGRGAQAVGSGTSKPPTGNPTQPTTVDLVRTALNQAPPNDCAATGRCLAAGGEEEVPGEVDPETGESRDPFEIPTGPRLEEEHLPPPPPPFEPAQMEPGEAVVGPEGYPMCKEPPASVTMLGQPNGPSIVIPEGAEGPTPTRSPGVQYTGGRGGPGLDPRTSGVRIMEPDEDYPAGRATYMNPKGQTVNPQTGRTIAKGDPWWHIPLFDWLSGK